MGRAVEFARFENEICHANSTYFVLLTSDFYNLFSKSNRKILSQIHDMGNDIGLHFDELNYGENEDIVDCINNEIKILEQLVGFGVNAVSMHRPSKKILESNLRLQSGVINSYSDEFFKGFKYVSDSRRNWREDVDSIVESGEYDRLHILTHPFWYFEQENTLDKTITGWIKNATIQRYDCLEKNFTDLDKVVDKRIF
jgi:hypothetical protein